MERLRAQAPWRSHIQTPLATRKTAKGVVLVWYVIQVINGREDVMRERIERVVPASAMQELFYPQF